MTYHLYDRAHMKKKLVLIHKTLELSEKCIKKESQVFQQCWYIF